MTKILIVDDDRYSRNILSRLLEKMDFEVIQCASINEGLQTAQQGEIDLIFLDVYFPDVYRDSIHLTVPPWLGTV